MFNDIIRSIPERKKKESQNTDEESDLTLEDSANVDNGETLTMDYPQTYVKASVRILGDNNELETEDVGEVKVKLKTKR